MSFYAMTWAWEYAPVTSMAEKGVLMALANEAGPDGCNAFPSTNTIADQALCSPGHVTKVLNALRGRGIIALGDQSVAGYIDPRYRPFVYDIQIPFGWFSEEQIRKVNAKRTEKGLSPLTPEDRPPLGPPPARKSRSDKGVPNPSRGRRNDPAEEEEMEEASRGVSETPLEAQASDQGKHSRGVSQTLLETPLDEPRGVSETAPRGVSQTPNSVALNNNPYSQYPPQKGGIENRAHDAHTHASAPTPGVIGSKIQTSGAGVTNRDEVAVRRKTANDLGIRWHDFCEEQGTPFPKSEPGTAFGEFPRFTKMLAKVMITYPDVDEIWEALLALHGRNKIAPIQAMLVEQLVAGRRRRMRAVPNAPAGAEVAVSPEHDLADRAVAWWTEEAGSFVPSRSVPQLRQLLLEAFQHGEQPVDVANTLLACGKAGKACPAPWEFADMLMWIKRGKTPDQASQAATEGGERRSYDQVARDERHDILRNWMERAKRDKNPQAADGSAPSDRTRIMQGDVL